MLFGSFGHKSQMVEPDKALSGRSETMPVEPTHLVLGSSMTDVPPGAEVAYFGLGCFWGAERKFWEADGVVSTAVGYQGGYTPNPTYEEVCSGRTGHTEAVRVVFDPTRTSFEALLKVFWESHDPTQGMRQGNDAGTQYRSAIYTTTPEQAAVADASKTMFEAKLGESGYGEITTEIALAGPFYFAEPYHQQYLFKNPNGYCGLGGTGVSCPIGLATAD
jgi:peptide-methionine (S)-S-oxide reductase